MKRGAGILLQATQTGRCLFLRRLEATWDLPGGLSEQGDRTALATTMRELTEETGYAGPVLISPAKLRTSLIEGRIELGHLWRRAEVRYTTFVGRVEREFRAVLDAEHTAFEWRPVDRPPQPLMLGVGVALEWAASLKLV